MGSNWKFKNIQLKFNNKRKFTKFAIAATLLSTITLNVAFAGEQEVGSLDKIYHVYVEDTYIGPVSDKESLDQVIESKKQEAEEQYKELATGADTNVTLIPEQVFVYEANDSTTLSKLNEQLEVQVDAYAIEVNGNQVAYVKNSDDYEEALRQYKLQFVTEEQLTQLEKTKQTNEQLPELKANETRLVDLSIKEEISGSTAKVNLEKILTPQEAVQFLNSGTLVKELYTVKSGDVLGKIANNHGLKTKELLELNPDLTAESVLQIGQQINVTVTKPVINIEKVYEHVSTEVIPFEKIVEEDPTKFKGEDVVKQEGVNGEKEVAYLVKEVNGKQVEKNITKETVLVEPKNNIVVKGTKVISSRGTGQFVWPTSGGYISSYMGERWGSYHRGIDIARPSNYNIKASDNGVVVAAGWDGSYGQKVVINHKNGYQTLYAHLSEIKVSVGQVVPQGTVIGIMGTTGRSTGIHLHFEVQKNGSLVNPLSVLNK